MELFSLLLQTPTGAPAQQQANPMVTFGGIIIMVAVFYFVFFRANSKTKKKRTDMLSGIKKNDKVMTIGGIIGTVTSVRDREVTIKVDETTNTKMTFTKDAVRTIVTEESDLTVEGS